jgi:5-methylcytosine-specific restriction endonuclease McrA
MEAKVLVLNQDYQAISVCSPQRAFTLCYLQKAEMLDHYPQLSLRSISRQYKYPSIIRLYTYVKVPYRKVSLSRINVFRRDGYECQYCGATQHLTIDHVLPRSRGGRDTWENLVTACHDCNTRKGNKTPQEAHMPLRHEPFRPSFIMFLSNFTPRLHENWRPYLMM